MFASIASIANMFRLQALVMTILAILVCTVTADSIVGCYPKEYGANGVDAKSYFNFFLDRDTDITVPAASCVRPFCQEDIYGNPNTGVWVCNDNDDIEMTVLRDDYIAGGNQIFEKCETKDHLVGGTIASPDKKIRIAIIRDDHCLDYKPPTGVPPGKEVVDYY
ncbi:uncharacterized protein DSM5745_03886 [Aspergillus mulundensis]|uniref:Cyanovirin-N domain-containing protein n=1 Tax=Aspergillus mulundensis TaxID=1810919 RepID=A0A3D8SB74_9EURO|nr:hypothetical protein DSM5745_03886 [Aspergillus mulundensis]RDW83560.1 hypothetical protein DSM5745_03886 [Aspergillus mulundensis]